MDSYFAVVVHASGAIIFQGDVGMFDEPISVFQEKVTGLCPEVEYRFILYDNYGDGQYVVPGNAIGIPDFHIPDKCLLPGMIGTLSTGEVLFDAVGYWYNSDMLMEHFVVP